MCSSQHYAPPAGGPFKHGEGGIRCHDCRVEGAALELALQPTLFTRLLALNEDARAQRGGTRASRIGQCVPRRASAKRALGVIELARNTMPAGRHQPGSAVTR
jgi:hypothetical protein